jgi:outer membrane receptor protein involved in Fe transport
VWNDDSNTSQVDGHYIVNAFANYDFGNGITGALNVGNLLNKIVPAGTAGAINGSSTLVGAGMEPGRTFGASLRYAF